MFLTAADSGGVFVANSTLIGVPAFVGGSPQWSKLIALMMLLLRYLTYTVPLKSTAMPSGWLKSAEDPIPPALPTPVRPASGYFARSGNFTDCEFHIIGNIYIVERIEATRRVHGAPRCAQKSPTAQG